MIELTNICKTYLSGESRVEALRDINLSISEGEFIAIMGDSGSGKSTLLRIIGGLEAPTSGKYTYNGILLNFNLRKDIDGFRNQHIGFIFQSFELMNRYTLYENIEMPLICRNIPQKKRKLLITETAARLGIKGLLKKYPARVSGGQQQRAAVARAIVMDTPILLADEPTGALDHNNSLALMDEFVKLNKEGKTIIMVTHNHSLAQLAHRVITISDGQLVQ